ncbi:MAG: helix-turn-helix domain-containing protein, partial [Gemmatimonadaceae bacterium]|nr:helix-turn-helix domain-containing protein [Gemmatimonadaceae bacterium]
GNVRELQHAVERAVILSHDQVLPSHLFDHQRLASGVGGGGMHALAQQAMLRATTPHSHEQAAHTSTAPAGGLILNTLNVDDAERALIKRALEQTKGNRTKTADLLGISVRTLRNKLNGPQRAVAVEG